MQPIDSKVLHEAEHPATCRTADYALRLRKEAAEASNAAVRQRAVVHSLMKELRQRKTAADQVIPQLTSGQSAESFQDILKNLSNAGALVRDAEINLASEKMKLALFDEQALSATRRAEDYEAVVEDQKRQSQDAARHLLHRISRSPSEETATNLASADPGSARSERELLDWEYDLISRENDLIALRRELFAKEQELSARAREVSTVEQPTTTQCLPPFFDPQHWCYLPELRLAYDCVMAVTQGGTFNPPHHGTAAGTAIRTFLEENRHKYGGKDGISNKGISRIVVMTNWTKGGAPRTP